jgi:hypothetical protein
MTRHLLLAALLVFAATTAFAQNNVPSRSYGPTYPPDYFKYGPSWLGSRGSPEEFGHLFGPKRPEKLEKGITSVAVSQVGNGMAVGAWLWADVPVQPKHTYELRYQIRLHTKKGEEGPILGTAARPKGEGFVVKTQVADGSWNGLEAKVDITRKELSGMTNLPEVTDDAKEELVLSGNVIRPRKVGGVKGVFLRVEPFVYDRTADRFLTPGRTNALILYALVGKDRKVEQIAPLADWAAFTARTAPDELKPALEDLDAYRVKESGVGRELGRRLEDKDVKKETKLKILDALPLQSLNDFVGLDHDVFDVLVGLASGPDAELKAAAQKRIDDLREYNSKRNRGEK